MTTRAVEQGVLAGLRHDGVDTFLGVPFADAPFGAARFDAPAPPPSWSGVRQTFRYGPTVPKSAYPPAARAIFPEPTIPGADCLNLNVHAPAEADAAPVLVWIYGGSFQMGSNAAPEYDGSSFAREGVVCVVPNYRLGAEGFLNVEGTPSNRALRDIIAALEWVRRNIAAFGGDPSRVTVAGESAGAGMVAALLAAESARGLYHAAAMQSGPYGIHLDPAEAAAVVKTFAERLGRPPTRDSFAAISPDALVVEGDALVASVAQNPDGWGRIGLHGRPFAPYADGDLIADDPPAAVAANPVPMMLGTTRYEYRLFLPFEVPDRDIGAAPVIARAARYGLDEAAVRIYLDQPGATPWDALADIIGDWRFRQPALRIADARAAHRHATWVSVFDAVPPEANGGLGATHATDVPFLFGTAGDPLLSARVGAQPSTSAMRAFHGAWVRFAHRHDPGWRRYELDARATAVVRDDIGIELDPRGAEREAWR